MIDEIFAINNNEHNTVLPVLGHTIGKVLEGIIILYMPCTISIRADQQIIQNYLANIILRPLVTTELVTRIQTGLPNHSMSVHKYPMLSRDRQ